MGQKWGLFKGVTPLTPFFRNPHLPKFNPAYAPATRLFVSCPMENQMGSLPGFSSHILWRTKWDHSQAFCLMSLWSYYRLRKSWLQIRKQLTSPVSATSNSILQAIKVYTLIHRRLSFVQYCICLAASCISHISVSAHAVLHLFNLRCSALR